MKHWRSVWMLTTLDRRQAPRQSQGAEFPYYVLTCDVNESLVYLERDWKICATSKKNSWQFRWI